MLPSILLRNRALSAASVIFTLAAFHPDFALAQTASGGSGHGETLSDQVRELTALVQAQSQKDKEQIQDLTEQVRSLQAQLAQLKPLAQSPAPLQQTATTRSSQNATGQFSLESKGPDTAEADMAVPRVSQNASNRFALQSGDGQYSIGFTGDIQFDTGDYLGFRPDSKTVGPQALSNGMNARRARIGVAGTAFGSWGYALVYDAGNSSDQTAKGIETAQILYAGIKGAAFEIGYSNTFFTLDQSTSSNDTLFLERASPSNIATNFNTGDARANAGARFFGDRYWVGAYLTGPASGDSHTLTAERFGSFQRVAVQALKGADYSLHLGLGFDELFQAPNSGNGTVNAITSSDQPELRIDPTTFLNTGTVGSLANPVTGAYVLNLETAATYKSLFWQGEYYRYQIRRQDLANADFDGGYGELSWTLTGETHKYNPQAASYFRIAPTHPFSLAQGGWGAWEVAARLSYVDLTSNFRPGVSLAGQPSAIDGGIQRGYTLGLNWYPNDLVRLLLDYNHVSYDKANAVTAKGTPLGAPVGANLDALSLRVQVAY